MLVANTQIMSNFYNVLLFNVLRLNCFFLFVFLPLFGD